MYSAYTVFVWRYCTFVCQYTQALGTGATVEAEADGPHSTPFGFCQIILCVCSITKCVYLPFPSLLATR